MSPFTTFANRLAWARHHRGLTLEALAKIAGISKSMIGRYEKSAGGVSTRFLRSSSPQRLADALQVNAIWLMTGNGEPFSKRASDEDYADMIQEVSSSKKEVLSMRLWNRYLKADAPTQALVNVLLTPEYLDVPWMTDSLRLSLASVKAIATEALKNSSDS